MNAIQPNRENTNKNIVRRIYDECLNHGRLATVDELIAPEFVNPGPNYGPGPEGYKMLVRTLRNAFPDIHFTLHQLIAEGDFVAVRWTWEGRHEGAFMNLPATHKRTRQDGFVMYRLENGKVAELNLLLDRLGMLQQLGVMPELPGIPKPPAPQSADSK